MEKLQVKDFPFEAEFKHEENDRRVIFVRDTLKAGDHSYRVTIAYRVTGVRKTAPAHDPAFTILAGVSFCHDQGADVFTRFRGREEALTRLLGKSEEINGFVVHNEPVQALVYIGQQVTSAVYKTLARAGRAAMEKAHVPTRLIGVLKRLVTKLVPFKVTPKQTAKARRAFASRKAFAARYNAALDKGATKEEARKTGIAAAREAATWTE